MFTLILNFSRSRRKTKIGQAYQRSYAYNGETLKPRGTKSERELRPRLTKLLETGRKLNHCHIETLADASAAANRVANKQRVS